MVNQSLRAIHLFQSGRDYIVKDGQIIIIDEQTGRQLPGRRFGMITSKSRSKRKLNHKCRKPNFGIHYISKLFKLYEKIDGCTGTALTESEEFFEIYNLPVVSIPTNKQMIRKDWNDQIFRTSKEKMKQ